MNDRIKNVREEELTYMRRIRYLGIATQTAKYVSLQACVQAQLIHLQLYYTYNHDVGDLCCLRSYIFPQIDQLPYYSFVADDIGEGSTHRFESF